MQLSRMPVVMQMHILIQNQLVKSPSINTTAGRGGVITLALTF